MPAPDAISDLPQRIIDALRIEVEWTVHEPDGFGLGFVAGELGVWLATRDDDRLSALHIEVRVARHVPDGPDVRKFCETRNHYGLVGRWVHDAATVTVSLSQTCRPSTPRQPRRSWSCCDRLHRSYTGVPVVAG
jgi:hypothetical protein